MIINCSYQTIQFSLEFFFRSIKEEMKECCKLLNFGARDSAAMYAHWNFFFAANPWWWYRVDLWNFCLMMSKEGVLFRVLCFCFASACPVLKSQWLHVQTASCAPSTLIQYSFLTIKSWYCCTSIDIQASYFLRTIFFSFHIVSRFSLNDRWQVTIGHWSWESALYSQS